MIIFSKKNLPILVALVLAAMFVVEISSAWQSSQIIDESPHLAAGHSYWQTGQYLLNPEHPPLIKLLAAMPLQFFDLAPLSDNPGWLTDNQWWAGTHFLYHNTVSHTWLLFWGRLPIMLLSIALGWLIYKWSSRLFGPLGGLISVVMYAFDPTILGHSRWITTDLGIALGMFGTMYALSRFFERRTWLRAGVFALVFALAQVTKFSAIILVPLTLAFLLIDWWQNRQPTVKPGGVSRARLIWLTLGTTFLVVWASYGFQIQTPYSDPEVARQFAPGKSQIHYDDAIVRAVNLLTDTETAIGKRSLWLAQNLHVSAYSYFKGFGVLANHNFWGHTAYLLGEYSKTGWWYYFPVAFVVKSPLTTLAFLAVLLWWSARYLYRGSRVHTFAHTLKHLPISHWILFVTPLAYFAWTLTSKLNLGVRHELPIFPFLFVGMGAFGPWLAKVAVKSWLKYLWGGLTAFFLLSSSLIYPHYLSYFNEAVGGPRQGHRYLLDSNIDWGQDLLHLKRWLDERKIDFIYFHYFGTADPRAYGIEHESPPTNEEIASLPSFQGLVAISLSGLYSEQREYSWLLEYEPIDRIGYSILIYDIPAQ